MLKPLSEVTENDIKDATKIEAVTQDDKSDPKTIWHYHGTQPEDRKGPGQPYSRGRTLVVKLKSDEDLPKLQAMVSDVAGRDVTEDD